MSDRLRVLVVDDSAFNRQTITRLLEGSQRYEVVGKAFDGEEGLKLASELKPDLITLDIEMPRMDGFTFLRILMSRLPTPVIVISSHSRKHEVFQALELGALDFIAKPGHHIEPNIESFEDELLAKADTVRALHRLARPTIESPARAIANLDGVASNEVLAVCIGASTGGPPAIEHILKSFEPNGHSVFLIVQHMPEKFTRAFAERLDKSSELSILEGEAGVRVVPDCVYIAPGGQHMTVERAADGSPVIALNPATPEDRYAPSVDRLFASVAEMFGDRALAVVLTGMGFDGSVGVRDIHKRGGLVVAESEETSVVFGMPLEAKRTGCVHETISLNSVAQRIQDFVGARLSRDSEN